MATPKLNTTKVTGARPMLRNSGVVPTKQVRLKGADGKAVKPAPKPAVKPATPAPAPAAEEPITAPLEEVTPTPAPVEEVVPAAAEETPVAETPAAEAPAAETADDEAARLAQEEYERQMEEYNRQMAEYEAAQAAAAAAELAPAEAAEEAPAPAEEVEPEPSPAEEAAPAEEAPVAAAPAPVKKKKKKAPARLASDGEGPTEEELEARDAYIAQLQADANRTPVWKKLPFILCVGGLVAAGIGAGVYVAKENARTARIEAHRAYIKKILMRAQEINQKGVETVADAKAKGVDVSCNKKEAKALLEVVVDPFVKSESGSALYGGNAEGVAQQACLLLGLASESDEEICKLVFDTLASKCRKIRPGLFRWLIQRVAISDREDVNAHLRTLAQSVSKEKDWKAQPEILSYIWECIGLRVTKEDVPEIMALIKSDNIDNRLAKTLCICLDNILMMMDNADEKKALGDEVFDNLPEKFRHTSLTSLAKACSEKALAHYKEELKNTKTWRKGDGLTFVGFWGDDSILDYVMELKEVAGDDPALSNELTRVVSTIFSQNRDRSDADAEKLLKMFNDRPFADTSKIAALNEKIDPAAADYIGDTHPDLKKLQDELKALMDIRKDKMSIIRTLASLHDHKWVTNLLEKFIKDNDRDVSLEAEKALEKTKANAVRDAQQKNLYKKRNG